MFTRVIELLGNNVHYRTVPLDTMPAPIQHNVWNSYSEPCALAHDYTPPLATNSHAIDCSLGNESMYRYFSWFALTNHKTSIGILINTDSHHVSMHTRTPNRSHIKPSRNLRTYCHHIFEATICRFTLVLYDM